MSKSTIFGCESFIDTKMISIRQSVDKYILDEIYKTSVKINVNVDEVRLEKWLKLCLQLENIEQSDLIDMAIKKRIADLSQENQKLK
ncbi:MAG: hypothetical protein GX638_13145, partial [Crenarchaeota archaeon]|nr:hypothetical protein [Thermoproteota archaeon]